MNLEGPTSSHSSLRTFDLITEGKLMPCLRCPQSNALLPPARLTEVKRRSMVEATNNILGSLEVEVLTKTHAANKNVCFNLIYQQIVT